MKNRLSKVLASSGIASRRAAEELIFNGKVKVNGEVVRIPQTIVDTDSDKIMVHNQPVKLQERKLYFLLHKPVGYVCSAKRMSNDKIVLDLFEDISERLFTVGRLDKNTSGLLLVTNDGHFANQIMHPSFNIQKEYVAKTNQEITDEHLKAISYGTMVEGVFVKPIRVSKVRKGTVKLTLAEGKKREARILLESAGLKVLELSRIRIGSLHLGKIPVGKWRELTEKEKNEFLEGDNEKENS